MNTTFVDDVKDRINRLKLQESYAGLVLGAIIVIVLGLLVANYFSRPAGQIGTAESISQQPTQFSASSPRAHKVAAGESLSAIAKQAYGSEDYWVAIARANNIANPDVIFADSSLTLPAKNEAEAIKSNMAVTNYQVQAGDTLFVIAEKVYGDGNMWQTIDRANGVGRLANGNPLIFAGSTLKIPR